MTFLTNYFALSSVFIYFQTDTLAHYSNYEEDGLAAVMKRMACLVLKAGTGKLTAIKTKYTTSKLLKISTLAELKGRVIQNYASGNVE